MPSSPQIPTIPWKMYEDYRGLWKTKDTTRRRGQMIRVRMKWEKEYHELLSDSAERRAMQQFLAKLFWHRDSLKSPFPEETHPHTIFKLEQCPAPPDESAAAIEVKPEKPIIPLLLKKQLYESDPSSIRKPVSSHVLFKTTAEFVGSLGSPPALQKTLLSVKENRSHRLRRIYSNLENKASCLIPSAKTGLRLSPPPETQMDADSKELAGSEKGQGRLQKAVGDMSLVLSANTSQPPSPPTKPKLDADIKGAAKSEKDQDGLGKDCRDLNLYPSAESGQRPTSTLKLDVDVDPKEPTGSEENQVELQEDVYDLSLVLSAKSSQPPTPPSKLDMDINPKESAGSGENQIKLQEDIRDLSLVLSAISSQPPTPPPKPELNTDTEGPVKSCEN